MKIRTAPGVVPFFKTMVNNTRSQNTSRLMINLQNDESGVPSALPLPYNYNLSVPYDESGVPPALPLPYNKSYFYKMLLIEE